MARIDPLDGGYGLRNPRRNRPRRLDAEFFGHLAVRLFLFAIMAFGFYLGGDDLIGRLHGLSDSVRTVSGSGPSVIAGR